MRKSSLRESFISSYTEVEYLGSQRRRWGLFHFYLGSRGPGAHTHERTPNPLPCLTLLLPWSLTVTYHERSYLLTLSELHDNKNRAFTLHTIILWFWPTFTLGFGAWVGVFCLGLFWWWHGEHMLQLNSVDPRQWENAFRIPSKGWQKAEKRILHIWGWWDKRLADCTSHDSLPLLYIEKKANPIDLVLPKWTITGGWGWEPTN